MPDSNTEGEVLQQELETYQKLPHNTLNYIQQSSRDIEHSKAQARREDVYYIKVARSVIYSTARHRQGGRMYITLR